MSENLLELLSEEILIHITDYIPLDTVITLSKTNSLAFNFVKHYFQTKKKLDLTHVNNMDENILEELLDFGSHITWIGIGNNTADLGEESIMNFLRELSVEIVEIHFTEFNESLVLDYFQKASDVCGGISSLILDYAKEKILMELVTLFPQLTNLSLCGCRCSYRAYAKIAESCPLLTRFSLCECQTFPGGVDAVTSKCTGLDSLSLRNIALDSDHLWQLDVMLSRCRDNVTKLDLSNNIQLQEGYEAIPRHCRNLKVLYLSKCGLEIDDFTQLFRPGISEKIIILSVGYNDVGDQIIPLIGKMCPSIKALDISGTRVTDRGLKIMLSFPEYSGVEAIWMKDCPQITTKGVRHLLKHLKRLKAVDITGSIRTSAETLKKEFEPKHLNDEWPEDEAVELKKRLAIYHRNWHDEETHLEDHVDINRAIAAVQAAYSVSRRRNSRQLCAML
eukprot:gb/GECH01000622.1/.p1 GENE.gb/GECH01000622.1/~~gb/GECH01000622.1/.p1  ORF type:complete len:448 (+),score=86.21 gb/GECH01000622.1/:1-1344(+)